MKNLYNKFLENILLPLGDIALNTHFIDYLKKWRKIQWYTPDKIRSLERESLKKLLAYASDNVPYYRDLQIDNNREDPVQWLKDFPVLYKRTIKANMDQLVMEPRHKLVREVSSGSSGIQGEVYMTRAEMSKAQAIQTLLWEWSGYYIGAPLLQLGMTTKRGAVKRVKDLLFHTDYQQAFDINEKEVVKALQRARNQRVFFAGYASGLYAYAATAGINEIKDVRFNAVISWGDKMFEHYRAKIKEVFKAPVYDVYGSTEGLTISGQCEKGRYHVMSPHVYVELLDREGNEVQPGEMGYVVVTRLDGFAMPLIRYYLGDLAERGDPDEVCECGRGFPMLRRIIGRDTDVVRTRSGKFLIVHFFTGIFEHYPQIKQFQVVQSSLDYITINYVPDELSFRSDVLDIVQEKIQDKLQEPFVIHFNPVNDIAPTASGKPQIIQSTLPK